MNTIAPRTSVTAIMSLVFGIVSWCGLFFIGGIVAIVCGHIARGEIRAAAPGSVDGDGMALAGLILGYVNVVLSVLAFLAVFLFLGGVVFLSGLAG